MEAIFLQIQPVDVTNITGWAIAALTSAVAALFWLNEKRSRETVTDQRREITELRNTMSAVQKERLDEALAQQAILRDVQEAMTLLHSSNQDGDMLVVLERIERKIDELTRRHSGGD